LPTLSPTEAGALSAQEEPDCASLSLLTATEIPLRRAESACNGF
jgi:hypothetical protein